MLSVRRKSTTKLHETSGADASDGCARLMMPMSAREPPRPLPQMRGRLRPAEPPPGPQYQVLPQVGTPHRFRATGISNRHWKATGLHPLIGYLFHCLTSGAWPGSVEVSGSSLSFRLPSIRRVALFWPA